MCPKLFKKTLIFVFVILASVVFAQSALAVTVTWSLAGDGNWETASNWSTNSVPGSGDDVVIDTARRVTINNATTIQSLTVGVPANNVQSILQVNYDAFANPINVTGNVTVYGGGSRIIHNNVSNNGPVLGVFIKVAGNMLLTGNVEAVAKGCPATANGAGSGPDANGVCKPNVSGYGKLGADTSGGAAHKGAGGSSYSDDTLKQLTTYDTNATMLGSSAGSFANPAVGGIGGGRIRLDVKGTLTINGTVNVNGGNGGNNGGSLPITGGGSGGSVLINAGTLAGGGAITANGGEGGNAAGNYAGAGGGGFVKVNYNNNSGFNFANATANAGNSGNDITPATAGTVSTVQTTGPAVSFSATSSNGLESVTSVNLPVTLAWSSGSTVTVDYAVTGGTATGGGADYTLASGTLTFAAGETTKNIAITIVNDTDVESPETIIVGLSNPSNAYVGINPSTTYTITDNDGPPVVYFKNVATNGPESNPTPPIEVSLSWASASTVTVDYAVTGGTATGGGVDFTLAAGTVTFSPSETLKSFSPTIVDDATLESAETIIMTLSNPVNSSLGGQTNHTYTINDNDATPLPSLSVADLSGSEAAGNFSFTVTLSAPSAQEVRVDYNTSNGSATAGADFTNAAGTLIFNAGQTSKVINVPITDDALNESNETFNVNLTNPTNATISDAQAVGTINDNDPAPSLSMGDRSSLESNASIGFTVVLSAASGRTVTVDFNTTNGTAVNTVDYTASAGTLTFNAGETSKSINVSLISDTMDENNETFFVNLTNSGNATISDNQAIGTINDDDTAGVNVIQTSGSTNVTEGGATDTFNLVLTSKPTADVVVTPEFNATQLSLDLLEVTFTPDTWNVPQTLTVTAVDDFVDEGTLTSNIIFAVTSVDATYNSISIGNVSTQITDNDTAGISVAGDVAVTEGGVSDTYTIVLTTKPIANVVIAIDPDGEVDTNLTELTFTGANWNTPQAITVTAIDDDVAEGSHTGVIAHIAASAGDSNYNGYDVNSINVSITDDDSKSVSVVETGGGTTVSRDGLTDLLRIKLTSKPTAGVTINMLSSSLTLQPASITFTTSNWNQIQEVTVDLKDGVDESILSGSINFSVSGDGYTGISVTPITVTITAGESNDPGEEDNGFDLMRVIARDLQAPEGAVIELRARILNKIEGLTYQWTQLSGPAVDITNATSLTASITTPAFDAANRVMTFSLTVSDGTSTMTSEGNDVGTIKVMPQNVQLENPGSGGGHTNHIPGIVRAVLADGTLIIEKNMNVGDLPRHAIEVNGTLILPDSNGPIGVLVVDPYLIISDAQAFNNRGLTAIMNMNDPLSRYIDFRDDSSMASIDWWPMGNQELDYFGYDVSRSDSGGVEIAITAPGASSGGAVFFFNLETGDFTNVITGYDDRAGNGDRLTSLMINANINGAGDNETIVGIAADDQSTTSRAASLFAGFTEPQSVTDLSDANFSFATENTTGFVGAGDLNGDDYDDIVLASNDDCSVEVHFGSSTLEDIATIEKTVLCNGSINSMAVGDVDGDGFDDVVLGDSENGVLYVLLGGDSLSEFIVISSADGELLGDSIYLTDYDGDGQLDVVCRLTGETFVSDIGGLLNGETGGWIDDGYTSSAALGGGGFTCALNTNGASPQSVLGLMVLTISLMVSIVTRMVKGNRRE